MTILNKNLRYFKNDLIVAYPRFNRLIGSLCVGRLRQVLRGIRPISFTRNTTPFVDMKSGGLLLSRAFSINKNAEGEYIAPNEINSAKSLHQFYSFLIKGKIFVVEEAVGKKPLRNAFNRIPLDLSTISQKWFGQLRLSLDESMPRKVIIVDLDLQKEDWGGNVDIVRKVKSTIIGLAKKYDFTLVESPSGGLHAYFSNDAFGCVKNDLSRTVNCGLKEVDLLTTGISSPSIFERKILNISSIWIKPSSQLNAEVPKALMPVLADKTHEKALRKAFCNKYPYPLQKGQRALNLLTI